MHGDWLEAEFENIGTLNAMESEQERALESCRVDEEDF